MSSRSINIAGLVPIHDPYYRYTMPSIEWTIVKNKTVIVNLPDVAQKLRREPAEIMTFWGQTLCVATHDTTLHGKHTSSTLQTVLSQYIELFVLCPTCRRPETRYKMKKGVVYLHCKDCGARNEVASGQDHRLCKYIVSREKKLKETRNGALEEKEKRRRKKKKMQRASIAGSKDAKKKSSKNLEESEREKEKHLKNEDKKKGEMREDDRKSESASLNVESYEPIEDEDEFYMANAVDSVKSFLKEFSNASDEQIMEEVTNRQLAASLKSYDRIKIFVRATIAPNDSIRNGDIAKWAPVMRSLISGQRFLQRHLIAGIEYVCLDQPQYFPVMLQQLYDEDVLEEETILEWADITGLCIDEFAIVDVSTREILHRTAAPFVQWLREAESEDGDGEN